MWRNTELLVKSHFNFLNPTFRSPSCLLRVRPVIDRLILFSGHIVYFKEVQKYWSCWGLINTNTPVLYIPASALETIETQGTPDENGYLYLLCFFVFISSKLLRASVHLEEASQLQFAIYTPAHHQQTICFVLKVQRCDSLGENVCIVCVISTAACGRSQGESLQGYLLETGSRETSGGWDVSCYTSVFMTLSR